MNWAILLAVIVISAVSKSNPKLGGWLGVVLTTGILLWGLSIYSDPYSAVVFFGITLTLEPFLLLMLAFYGYDAWQLYKAYRTNQGTG